MNRSVLIYKGRMAFTLVELLVVIAIIGVMVGLLLPAVQAAREAARRMSCSNNLKQISLGFQNYHDTFNTLPPGAIRYPVSGNTPNTAHFWSAFILPFIELSTVHDQIAFGGHVVWTTGGSLIAAQSPIPTYRCPSSTDPASINNGVASPLVLNRVPNSYSVNMSGTIGNTVGTASYPARAGETQQHFDDGYPTDNRFNGPFNYNRSYKFATIIDGLSNTVSIGEKFQHRVGTATLSNDRVSYTIGSPNINDNHAQFGGSMGMPINIRNADHQGAAGFRSLHPGGCQVAYLDGSARFVSDTVAPEVRLALGTRDGGEIVPEF